MIILGITGGSGCGKTTVCECLKKNGIDVIDTDKIARLIVEPGQPALNEIKEEFGIQYINNDNTLNRKKMADTVFNNQKELQKLNAITHKYITEYVDEYINNCKGQIIAIDAAALIESGIYKKCDYILSVLADEDTRIKRIMTRDNILLSDAKSRIKAQKNDCFYIEKSDFIIYNNGDLEKLSTEINQIIDKLKI